MLHVLNSCLLGYQSHCCLLFLLFLLQSLRNLWKILTLTLALTLILTLTLSLSLQQDSRTRLR